MPDTAIGFVLLGIGILVVLGVVFAISSRAGTAGVGGKPPRGVHMPGPSYLPVVISLAVALIGAGLVFRGDDQLVNPFLAIPGLVLFVIVSVAWVRAASHEWREVEHGSHDDASAH